MSVGYQNIKQRTYALLEKGSRKDIWSLRVDWFIIGLIVLNVLSVMLGSVKWVDAQFGKVLSWFEWFSVAIFAMEYLLRIWSITEKKKYAHSITGRIKYFFSFYSLIDILAILPALLPFFGVVDLRILRSIRLFRLFRVLKLTRYYSAFSQVRKVLRNTKEELVISLFAVLTLLVIASSLMFFAENQAQPEAFSSIPATMWWGVATLTTVGYGDIYPITDLGKFLAGVMAILGVGIFALPAGILASGFSELSKKKEQESQKVCPNCGFTHN